MPMPPLAPVTAAARSFAIPASPWLAWTVLAVAVLFAAALTVLLLVLARRGRWPGR